MMKYFEQLFYFLFPTTYLKGTPWEHSWLENEKLEFVKSIKLFFCITTVGYILHYHTVDVAEGLAPSDLWFKYRYGMATLSLISLFIYHSKPIINKLKYYRFPALIVMGAFCYFQARTSVWYDKVPYVYSFAFIIVTVTMLKTNPLKSFFIGSIFSALVVKNLQLAKVSPSMIFSGIFFSLAVLVFTRTKYISDLRFFLITQKNLDQQRQIIEMNMDFTNQIKAFLPREISNRLTAYIQINRLGISQAIHEVLMPRKKTITCIFSDIRGFTKHANDLNGFVSGAMFPEVVACTKAIEDKKGISRKIGDLLLAYFDLENHEESFKSVVAAATEIARINTAFNKNLPSKMQVKRFILIGAGEAVVGNLSGYSSSIELTAIGKPINQLSRIDELTKTHQVQDFLQTGDIIFADDMYPYFESYIDSRTIELLDIDLTNLRLKVRDFESIGKIYVCRSKKTIEKSEGVA